MKVFRIEGIYPTAIHIYTIRSLRKFLKEYPQIQTVYREWWYGHDLVEDEEIPRDEILKSKASELKKGQTAQWAQSHL